MGDFELISIIESYALGKGYKFILGDKEYVNAVNAGLNYANNEMVLVCLLEPSLSFGLGGAVSNVRYAGYLMLGRKSEYLTTTTIDEETEESTTVVNQDTFASLDETMQQKYDRRLKELWQLLTNSLTQIQCQSRYTCTQASGKHEINMYNQNIDFVSFNVVLERE